MVICKTNGKWEPEPQTKNMYVLKESLHGLLKLRKDAAPSPATSTSTSSPSSATPSSTPAIHFEDVQWRDLRSGDKIRVTYVNVKNPSVPLTAYGIFRAAPTYSDVVEFVRTNETFTVTSKAFTTLPLTGSMCRFQRLATPKTFTHHNSQAGMWAPGSCATAPNTANANANPKKRKVA